MYFTKIVGVAEWKGACRGVGVIACKKIDISYTFIKLWAVNLEEQQNNNLIAVVVQCIHVRMLLHWQWHWQKEKNRCAFLLESFQSFAFIWVCVGTFSRLFWTREWEWENEEEACVVLDFSDQIEKWNETKQNEISNENHRHLPSKRMQMSHIPMKCNSICIMMIIIHTIWMHWWCKYHVTSFFSLSLGIFVRFAASGMRISVPWALPLERVKQNQTKNTFQIY